MMMSRIVPYLLAALNCAVSVSSSTAIGAAVKNHDLAEVISQYHDTHMVVRDLSYSLPLINYNATSKDGCVQDPIESTIYNAVPKQRNWTGWVYNGETNSKSVSSSGVPL